MQPQRKWDSTRLDFSKIMLACWVGTDRPVVLAAFDAFETVRRNGISVAVPNLS